MLYKLVFRKFSFKELWFLGKENPVAFLLNSLVKVFGGKVPCCPDNFNVESMAELRCSEESLPQYVRDAILPWQNQLAALGFHSPVCYALWDAHHVNRIYRIEYASQNGEGFARIHFRQWEKAHPIKKTSGVAFVSIFEDGSMLVSSADRVTVRPPNVTVNIQPKAAPDVLWHGHLAELHRLQKNIHLITTAEGVIWAGEKYHADFFNYYRQRGLLQPLSEGEQMSESTDSGMYQQILSTGNKYPEVLMEIKKLEEQKSPKWTRLIFLLAMSALLFVAVGIKNWGREYIYLLIPVLLFHEAGHYVMMKIFGYRNLKMFFIPLFGAAVSGRHYNVAGWKKVVVSLMGPTPGIFVGAVLGCLGLVVRNAFLQKFALLLLTINGFNLLPFLPLDGGWVMQGIVFSRHYFFDLTFKLVAALVMFGLSIALQTRALLYVSIATLVSLPMAFGLAKTTNKLRKAGFVAASSDNQNIPDGVAETIITELSANLPKIGRAGTSKNMARLALQVFENLNAKPPGWAASIGLLAWYGCTVLMAVVFGVIVIAGQGGGLTSLLANSAFAPRLKYDCHSVKSVRHGDTGSHLNIVLTTDKPAKAETAFNSLASQLGEHESLEKIGQTLLVSIPVDDKTARQAWLDRFETISSNTFVDWTNNKATFSFICVAPNTVTASNIAAELRDFFSLPQTGFYLIPPWTPDDPRSDAQKATDDKARRTYGKLAASAFVEYDSPNVRELEKKQADAQRHGDRDQADDLGRQIRDFTKQMRKNSLDKLLNDPALDASIIELYEKREDLSYTNNARKDVAAEMTKKMGVAGDQRQPLAGPGLYSAGTGGAVSTGLYVRVNFVWFADSFEGVPAFLDWLCAQHCIGIRYSVTSMPYLSSDEEND
jgi:Zn-dependent protease